MRAVDETKLMELALTDESSPACVIGGFEAFTSASRIAPALLAAFQDGRGVGWDQHEPGLFRGTARFFRPGYVANVAQTWLPALDGVTEVLAGGGTVANCIHSGSCSIRYQPWFAHLHRWPRTSAQDSALRQAKRN